LCQIFYIYTMISIHYLNSQYRILHQSSRPCYNSVQLKKNMKNMIVANTYSKPYLESKSYQINSIKSWSSRSFQQHQMHIPIPPKFSATI
jgi:hypothetical protein